MATNSLQTASQTMVLNPDGSYGPALWSINYYDDKGRSIAAYQQHYFNATASAANYDMVTTAYDFTNEVTVTNRQHYTTASGSPAVTIANTYAYDHMGRQAQQYRTD